jgi:hypothetical protein
LARKTLMHQSGPSLEIAPCSTPRHAPAARSAPRQPSPAALDFLRESGVVPIIVSTTGAIRVSKAPDGFAVFWLNRDHAHAVCHRARMLIDRPASPELSIACLYEASREYRTRLKNFVLDSPFHAPDTSSRWRCGARDRRRRDDTWRPVSIIPDVDQPALNEHANEDPNQN